MTDVEVPVLIVGGGGASLTTSMLLAKLGVETLLVKRAADDLDPAPGAHVMLNQRAVEVLDRRRRREGSTRAARPREPMRYTPFYAGRRTRPARWQASRAPRVLGRRRARHRLGVGDRSLQVQPPPEIRLEPLGHAESPRRDARALQPRGGYCAGRRARGVTAVTVRYKNDGLSHSRCARATCSPATATHDRPQAGVEPGIRVTCASSIYTTADLSAGRPTTTRRSAGLAADAVSGASLVPMGLDALGTPLRGVGLHLSCQHDATARDGRRLRDRAE